MTSSADSDGDQKTADESEDDSDAADLDEEEDDYETSSDDDAEADQDETSDMYEDRESDPPRLVTQHSRPSSSPYADVCYSGQRFLSTRQMHVLYNSVTLCRLGRMIASVQQSSAEALAKNIEAGVCNAEVKARSLAQLRNAAANARACWAREMQSELEIAEQYRVAMIQVLQEEIRR